MAEPAPAPDPAFQFQTKAVSYLRASSTIVLQNKNGPCPLLALVNALILRRQLTVGAGADAGAAPDVPCSLLLQQLAGVLLDRASADAARDPNVAQQVADAIALLPRLATGLDVNVCFSGPSAFEFTPELALFDLLGIRLVHGWLPDPADAAMRAAVKASSYNQLAARAVSDTDGGAEQEAARTFLVATAGQLTAAGVRALLSHLRDGELAVLFRNNHFATLLRRGEALYVLVSDAGYRLEPNVVWETLSGTGGDSFYTADFVPLSAEGVAGSEAAKRAASLLAAAAGSGLGARTTFGTNGRGHANHDADYALALQLSLESGELDKQSLRPMPAPRAALAAVAQPGPAPPRPVGPRPLTERQRAEQHRADMVAQRRAFVESQAAAWAQAREGSDASSGRGGASTLSAPLRQESPSTRRQAMATRGSSDGFCCAVQ